MEDLNFKEGYTYMLSNVSKLLKKSTEIEVNREYILLQLQIILLETERITIEQ